MTVQELIDELTRVPAELRASVTASVNGDSIESVTYAHGELLINHDDSLCVDC